MNRERLAKLLALLGSDRDGEVLAAVHGIRRTLAAAGADLHDLAGMVSGGKEREFHRADPPRSARPPRRARSSNISTKLAETLRERDEAIKSRDALNEQLGAARDEIFRLRSEVDDLVGRPRGSLPPSWMRCSPIERLAILECWSVDENLSSADRQWSLRLRSSMINRCEADHLDIRKFNSLIRRNI